MIKILLYSIYIHIQGDEKLSTINLYDERRNITNISILNVVTMS